MPLCPSEQIYIFTHISYPSRKIVMSLNEEAVLKIPCPSSSIFSGPSGSGKSTLVYEILKHARGMFEKIPNQIIYCYNIYQNELFDRMKKDVDNLQFFQGIPKKEDLQIWSSVGQNSVLVIDDLMSQCAISQDICDLFTIFSHHMNFTVFFLVQNLFAHGKLFCTISLNAHQFALFQNQRDMLQIKAFAKQCYPEQTKYFMDAFIKATSSKKFGYLFIDLSPHLSGEEILYRLRTNILPGETCIVYLPCDTKY